MAMSFFRRTAILAGMSAAVSAMAASAAASHAPRAWLVSKGRVQAVLVGESHFGTPAENDNYFEAVIRPSYAAADTAVMETYWGAEQRGNEALDRSLPCPGDPKDRRTDKVRLAFKELIAATQGNGLKVPNWMEHWETLPEFLHTSLFLDQFAEQAFGREYTSAIQTQWGLGTSLRLTESGMGPVENKRRGLESLKDKRAIFCSASAANRQDFLADRVLQVVALLRLKQSNPSFAGLDRFAPALGRSLEATLRCVDLPVACAVESLARDNQVLRDAGWTTNYSHGTFEILVKQRTRLWIPLIENAMQTGGKTIIIVGALHLPDLSMGGKLSPGLISQLRARGYTVTSIAGPEDLKATFLVPSVSDRIRSWFGKR
jgi:hypothetical protein